MSVVQQHISDTQPDIQFTEAATKHFLGCLRKVPEYKGLRFSVKKTGCSGLSYVVDYVQVPLEHDLQMPFAEDYVLCVDKASYPFLKNLKIDYVTQGLNSKLVFNNPNQTGQCGCGESFTVDNF